MQWYYIGQAGREGPVDDAGLEDLARRGVIRDDTNVWHEGAPDWEPFAAVRARRIAPSAPQAAPAPAATPVARSADSKFFFYPVLRALSDGRMIRRLVIVALKVLAILIALGSVLAPIAMLGLGSQVGGRDAVAVMVVNAIVLLVTGLCVAQVYWYRAASVEQLGDSPYTIIPIASILFRMAGETTATMGIGIGVALCLSSWLGSNATGSFLGFLGPFAPLASGLSGFVGGIVILIVAAVYSFVFLVIYYLLAELAVVVIDIAKYLHQLALTEPRTSVRGV